MRPCFYHADLGQKAVFHNTNLHSFNIQDNGSTCGLLAKPLKKFPKSPILPFGSHFCSTSCGECLDFLFNGFTHGILSTAASDVH